MPRANPYRGQIELPLPSGEVVAVVDTNALRMYMEDTQSQDLTDSLAQIQSNPVDRIPRLLYWGVRQGLLLAGSKDEPASWEQFAAQCGQLDFVDLVERVSLALDLGGDEPEGDKKKAAKAAQ